MSQFNIKSDFAINQTQSAFSLIRKRPFEEDLKSKSREFESIVLKFRKGLVWLGYCFNVQEFFDQKSCLINFTLYKNPSD